MTTVREALGAGAKALRGAGVPGAERDARALMADALGCAPAEVSLRVTDDLPDAARARFAAHVAARQSRRPVSRILGGRWFYNGWFRVTDAVLDPRPETEHLVDLAIAGRPRRVLDLGTGSGCILVSILGELPEASGVGTDISPEAVLVAGENAARFGVADRAVFPLSDWFADIGGRFDLIVSNPPYIAADEMPGLEPEVRAHDPRAALTDEGDGLAAYRAIAAGAPHHLAPGGRLLLEIGPAQGAEVSAILGAAGLEVAALHPDLNGRDRVVEARLMAQSR